MINIDNFVKSNQIKFIYKIINSEMDSWNAIGKHWLQKYDNKFGVDFFLCKCSDFKVFPLKVKFLVFQTRVQLLILFRIFFPNVISVYIVPVKIS